MTDDLTAWLTQIWDAEEADAKLALGSIPIELGWYVVAQGAAADSGWSTRFGRAYQHIARHDPASVLARIAADRQILALHRMDSWSSSGKPGCSICHEDYDGAPEIQAGPCATVRLLASAYTDRPGYREEWRP